MDPNTNEVEKPEVEIEVDPWLTAFESLGKAGKEDTETAAAPGGDDSGEPEQAPIGQEIGQDVPAQTPEGDGSGAQVGSGIPDIDNSRMPDEGATPFGDTVGVSPDEIEQYRNGLADRIRNQAIKEVSQTLAKRGVRRASNGMLGATLDDKDICKRDEDGVPHFFNPETGREFTGDNPRRQAQEWVDDYNRELARVFNEACDSRVKALQKQMQPALDVVEFAPKYEKLDPIRKGMFDSAIEGYEIYDDNGGIVGYSCDLNKMLTLVDRQIAKIQDYAKAHPPQSQSEEKGTGPALDMKTSSGAVQSGEKAAPTSLAEAMERLQDAQLENLRRK